MIRCCGIDPGATTALVCLDAPLGARRPDLGRARWVGHAVVHPSRSTKLSEAERRAELGERVAAELAAWGPTLIVLEEPGDATATWASKGRRVGGGRSGFTSFGLGAHFGLALAAAYRRPDARVFSYPVNNHRGRPGWMQAGNARPQPREQTMAQLRPLARALGCPDAPDMLSEDVLMALGVLRFHLDHHDFSREAAS